MHKNRGKSIAARLSWPVSLLVLLCSIAMGITGIFLYRRDVVAEMGRRALAVSQAVVAAIDPDGMRAAMETGEKDARWEAVKRMADKTATDTNMQYLYVLGAGRDLGRDENLRYYMEGYNARSEDEEIQFMDAESADIYPEAMFASLRTGETAVSPIYTSGGFGRMVSGFAPVLDAQRRVVGVVGADVSIGEINTGIARYALRLLPIVLGFGFLICLAIIWLARRFVGRPIKALTLASEQIALGDTDVNIDVDQDGEIGALAGSFQRMARSAREQAATLERVSEGEMSLQIEPRSERDVLGHAIQKMVGTLNHILLAFRDNASRLSTTSEILQRDAARLADGVSKQNGEMEELAFIIRNVTEKMRNNTQKARRAITQIESVRAGAQAGSAQMEEMVAAVTQINEASLSIDHVMKAIDDIAFQTSVLSLNASVEAARAGASGKGFAVVAEEVQSLATKSANSAKETGSLIANSLEKSKLGVQIAGQTSDTFQSIVQGIRESGALMDDISKGSDEQENAIDSMLEGLGRVSEIVGGTETTARENKSAGEELRHQADELKNLLRHFKLRGESL